MKTAASATEQRPPTNMHATTDNPPSDDARPIPPRYWWLKRILAATVVLIVGLVALRLWWGWEADRRLQVKIAEYRAAGQPVLVEDFQHPPVPDEENAAYFLMKAAATMVPPPDSELFVEDLYAYPSGIDEYADAVSRWIDANNKALSLVRDSRGKPGVDWGIRVTSPAINILLPHLSSQRKLAKFLCVALLFEHERGNDAEAIDLLEDVLDQANRLGQGSTFIISSLVEVAINTLAVNALEDITPELLIEGVESPGTGFRRPVERRRIEQLITRLLDESIPRRNWRCAWYGERMWSLDCLKMPNMGIGIPNAAVRLFLPAAKLDAIHLSESHTLVSQASATANWPLARANIPNYPSYESGIKRTAHVLSRSVWLISERPLELWYMALVKRRMAAVVLAIRLYELDNGARPESLDVLTPEYLPDVPVDPFAADGRILGYQPNAQPPVLYSVGSDGADDNGEYALNKNDLVDRGSKDIVFFLDGDRPHAVPYSLIPDPNDAETIENEGEEVRDGGEAEQDQADGD